MIVCNINQTKILVFGRNSWIVGTFIYVHVDREGDE